MECKFRSMREMPVTANEHDLRTGMSVPHDSGALAENWRPNCVLTMIPPSPQRMHKVGQPASGTGETPVPLAGASAVTDC